MDGWNTIVSFQDGLCSGAIAFREGANNQEPTNQQPSNLHPISACMAKARRPSRLVVNDKGCVRTHHHRPA